MTLTYEKLIEFDLEKNLKEKLIEQKKYDQLTEFLETFFEIVSVDQFIRDLPSFPYATEKIIRSEMVRAIGSTLAIEGIALDEEEIKKSFEKTDSKGSFEVEGLASTNSRNVYKYIIDVVNNYDGEFVYAEEHIKNIHKYFTENIDYPGNVPGEYYRDVNPIFGEPPKRSFCKTKANVEVGISKLINWLNKPNPGLVGGNIIAKAMMAHYYLTEIHPFGDANGRVARALEALVLYVNHINPYCFWSLSNFWSSNRVKYIQHLHDIRSTCEPWEFLMWGIKGYLREIIKIKALVLKKIKQLMFMDYARYLWRDKPRRTSKRFMIALELLVQFGRTPLNKFYSSPEIKALYHSVSPPTKTRDFNKMKKENLINIATENDEKFIEPNFGILEKLQYKT